MGELPSPTTPESTDTMASGMLMLNQRLMLMLFMDTMDTDHMATEPMDTDTHTDTDTMASVMLMLNPRSLPTVLPFPTLLPLPTPSLPPTEVSSTLPWSEFAPTTSVPRSLAN